MKKIGLTGGIGSGKSVVAKIFNCLHVPIYESDTEAKRLMNSNDIIREGIITLLGTHAYSNNILQKQIIADAIFSDSLMRLKINSIVHPQVREDFALWVTKQSAPYVIMESALLFDSDLYSYFDKNIFVNASEEIRVQRVMARDNCNKEDVMNRIKMQPDNAFCLQKSDFVVENNNTFVIPQVIEIHKRILNE